MTRSNQPSHANSERRSLRLVGLGLFITMIGLGLDTLGVFQGLERRTIDARMTVLPRPPRPMTDQILHVDIDDSALDRFGRWPWDRATIADAVAELARAGAGTVALDLLLSEAQQDPEGDRRFAEALSAGPCVVPVVLHDGGIFDDIWRHGFGPAALGRLLRILGEDIQYDADAAALKAGLTGPRLVSFLHRPLEFKKAAAWHVLILAGDDAPSDWDSFERLMTPRRSELAGDYPEGPVLRSVWCQHEAWRSLRPLLYRGTGHPGTHTDTAPLPAFADAAAAFGFVNVQGRTHPDGRLRELPVVRAAPRGEALQFGVAAAAQYLGIEPDDVHIDHDLLTVGDVRIPLNDGDLWIAWPTSTATPRWAGLLSRSPTGDTTTAGHISIRELIELARARRTQLGLEEKLETLTRLILDYAQIDWEGEVVADPRLLQEAADEVAFTLEDLDPEPDPEPDPDEAFLDHLHNCRLWVEVRDALADARLRIEVATLRVRQIVEGKLVFVGWTATAAVADFVATSLEPLTPGVVVHAAVADMVLTGHGVRFVKPSMAAGLILLPALLCTLFSARLNAVRSTLLTAGVLLCYTAIGTSLFARLDLAIPIVAPLMTSGCVWISCTAFEAAVSQGDRRRITQQFRSRVSGQLVDYLVSNPGAVTVDGVEREMTVLFGDLAGFTTLSESLGGPRTVAMLNRYLSRLSAALVANGAYVNKFLGDGVMAFWSAFEPDPDQAIRAGAAIQACREAMVDLNRESIELGLPPVDLRIGVATGRVVVGDCGAPPELHDYTVIGDAVNLSARLESANKQFGTSNLVDGRTRALMQGSSTRVRPVGRIAVVGREASVEVFEVMEPDSSDELLDLSHRIVDAFTAGRLLEAGSELATFEARFGSSLFAERYRQAIDAAVDAEAFDGVLQLTEK